MRVFASAIMLTIISSVCAFATYSNGAPVVRVLLADGKRNISIKSDTAITVTTNGTSTIHDAAADLSVAPKGNKVKINGQILESGNATFDSDSPISIDNDKRSYEGALIIHATNNGLRLVNHVLLEDYVAGVIGYEMAPSWPIESLKAQAVATRSYVMYKMNKRRDYEYDVTSTVSSQVYRGIANQTESVAKAVQSTRGLVALYKGKIAETLFHSSSGGRTESLKNIWAGDDRQYLVAKPVRWEYSSPYDRWRARLSSKEIRNRLAKSGYRVGSIKRVSPACYTNSGRIKTLRIYHADSKKPLKIAGYRFREIIGTTTIRSTRFSVARAFGDKFVFDGRGYGHGVGMSQYGAKGMAERNKSFREILNHFYKGIVIAPYSESVASIRP